MSQKAGDLFRPTQTNMGAPPSSIIPKNPKKLKLLDIEPLELARQLTVKESDLYRKIRPLECLQRAREQRSDNMDNIATVIQTSNRVRTLIFFRQFDMLMLAQIADWVAEAILNKDDFRKRGNIVKHLITVADVCPYILGFGDGI